MPLVVALRPEATLFSSHNTETTNFQISQKHTDESHSLFVLFSSHCSGRRKHLNLKLIFNAVVPEITILAYKSPEPRDGIPIHLRSIVILLSICMPINLGEPQNMSFTFSGTFSMCFSTNFRFGNIIPPS
ncbi:hypothetical protein QCA50_015288 [Cerrena zonata]|uniref:Uncharacterized protein n=1 Tax=Cerrena zonata TaxID=2478898 RepID=A0AAW0FW36_9APHY